MGYDVLRCRRGGAFDFSDIITGICLNRVIVSGLAQGGHFLNVNGIRTFATNEDLVRRFGSAAIVFPGIRCRLRLILRLAFFRSNSESGA